MLWFSCTVQILLPYCSRISEAFADFWISFNYSSRQGLHHDDRWRTQISSGMRFPMTWAHTSTVLIRDIAHAQFSPVSSLCLNKLSWIQIVRRPYMYLCQQFRNRSWRNTVEFTIEVPPRVMTRPFPEPLIWATNLASSNVTPPIIKTTISCGLSSFDPWLSPRSGKSMSFIFPFAKLSRVIVEGPQYNDNSTK